MSTSDHWDGHFTDDQMNRDLVRELSDTGFITGRVIRSHRAPRSPLMRSAVSITSAVLTITVGVGSARVITDGDTEESHALRPSTSSVEKNTFRTRPTTPQRDKISSRASRVQRRDVSRPRFVMPVKNARVTSCWGPRWGRHHSGVDLAASHGTVIRSVSAGVVKQVGSRYSGYGITVVVQHSDGYMTIYAHASRTAVRVNDRVDPGDTIAYVGTTGHVTGPHLHLAVAKTQLLDKIFAALVNPAPWLADRGVRLTRCVT